MPVAFPIKRSWVLRLEKDEEVISSLINFSKREGIKAAFFYGLGLLKNTKLAVFDTKKERYEEFLVKEPMELVSMIGNIALRKGEPTIHVHVTLADENRVMGGHLVEGIVGATCEILITELDGELRRELEKDGLTLLDI